MMSKRLLAAAGTAVGMLMVPFTISPGKALTGNLNEIVRLQDACGQATECTKKSTYICSTHNQDHIDYQCSKGCGES